MTKKYKATFSDGVGAGVLGIVILAFTIALLVYAYNAIVDDIASRSATRAHALSQPVFYGNTWSNSDSATTGTVYPCSNVPLKDGAPR